MQLFKTKKVPMRPSDPSNCYGLRVVIPERETSTWQQDQTEQAGWINRSRERIIGSHKILLNQTKFLNWLKNLLMISPFREAIEILNTLIVEHQEGLSFLSRQTWFPPFTVSPSHLPSRFPFQLSSGSSRMIYLSEIYFHSLLIVSPH